MQARLPLGAFMAMLALAGPVAAAEPAVICNPRVSIANVRAGPGAKNFALVDTLPNKTPITVLDRTMNQEAGREWARIEFRGTKTGKTETGYVDSISVTKECVQTAQAGSPPATPPAAASAAPPLSRLEPELEFTLKGHGDRVHSAAFSPDGTRIVTASWDKTAKLWDAKSGLVLSTLSGHGDWVYSAAFSPDGARIVTASSDKTAKLWDAKNGSVLTTLGGHGNEVRSAAVSPDGTRIVTASSDKTAKLWDAKSGSVLTTLGGHEYAVYSAAFSPDGTRIVTASSDNTAKLWDAKSGSILATLSGNGYSVSSAAFSPDGTRIVTANVDKTAKLWDAKTGSALATLSGHADRVYSAVFSPDGTRIVTASSDKTAKLWDAKSGLVLATLGGHGNEVNSAAFSPDGTRVVTASDDRTAKLWVLSPTPEERASLRQRIAQAEATLKKQAEERKAAAAALECDKVKAIDDQIGADGQLEPCRFNKIAASGTARELYLAASKHDADKERDKAKTLYKALRDRFPNDDLAIEAAKRLTVIGDLESSEEARARAASAASAAADRAAASQRETREAIERSNREAAYQQQRQIAEQRQREYQACISRKVACESSCDGIRDSSPRIRCKWGCASCQAP